MPVIDVPDPAFMADEEIAVFRDAVGKFFEQHAPEKRVEKWREDGMVERAFWEEAGQAGLLGMTVPEISAALEVPAETIRSRLRAGMGQVRATMGVFGN